MPKGRWSADRAKSWSRDQPWFVGCNFKPSTASNQLEMWQHETFDPETIGREVGWAADIGMNSIRVFLHDLVWEMDPDGLKGRIETFLGLASQVGMKTMFVLFDDCWHPPTTGPQPEPVPGVHNSRWAQSPGHHVVRDRLQWPRLERYVRDIVGTFGQDERVCVWDVYNEPGNAFLPVASLPGYRATPIAIARAFRHFVLPSPTLPLLRATFEWARSAVPTQPLTAGVWAPIPRMAKFQIEASDIVSFHQYASAEKLTSRVAELTRIHERPVLCTEWMARPIGSRFETHLPTFKEAQVGCYCWGLVSGRTQTIHGWGDRPGTPAPEIWHHDVMRADGSPYDIDEVNVIRRLTKRGVSS